MHHLLTMAHYNFNAVKKTTKLHIICSFQFVYVKKKKKSNTWEQYLRDFPILLAHKIEAPSVIIGKKII